MILFAVNDAGPAKYIAYILRKLDSSLYTCIASNISSEVFDEFDINFIRDNQSIDLSLIKLIITGTCLGNGLDKDWVNIGKVNNIKTISIIEHWSLYKKRFELKGKYFFPDLILLNDEIAYREAGAEGIDNKLLKIMGNPVFENITSKNYLDEEKNIWKSDMSISVDQKIVTFISEEYKDDFPKESLEYQGFDEFEVLEDLINVLDENIFLFIKLHPAENKNKYNYLKKYTNVKVVDKTDVKKLIIFSDIFLGMGSMLLLEASLLRANVFSYRPNEIVEFIGNKNNMTVYIQNKNELKNIIQDKNLLKNKITKNNFIGSTSKIIKFIKEYEK